MAYTGVWRAMASLLVLRDQCDAIAPGRATGADGTIADDAHSTDSDHYPHDVPGVSPPKIVTAIDLTHDPAGGFDSYAFAETLRVNRDRRIKYVISNRRIFSSYAVTVNGKTYPAWTWRPYSGADLHTGHVHVSTLDSPVSDTRTPWNLEGFEDMTPSQAYLQFVDGVRMDALLRMKEHFTVPSYDNGGAHWNPRDEDNLLATAMIKLQDDVSAIRTAVEAGGTGGGGGGDNTAVLAAIEAVGRGVDALISGVRANAAAVSAG